MNLDFERNCLVEIFDLTTENEQIVISLSDGIKSKFSVVIDFLYR
jgi:hypothetical protein